MEEVLRLVELAEHQKFADERELESLRRALHKLQPPRREQREDRPLRLPRKCPPISRRAVSRNK